MIIDKCSKLKRLGVPHFYNLTDRLVQDMSLALEGLIFLDLSSCNNITNNALYYLANNLELNYLFLDGCSSITDEGLQHILRKDAVNNFSMSPRRDNPQKRKETFNNKLPSHKKGDLELQIGTCSTNLKQICLSKCNKITDQSILFLCECSPNLEHLDLSFCDQLTDASIEYISRELSNLESLNLSMN